MDLPLPLSAVVDTVEVLCCQEPSRRPGRYLGASLVG